MSSIKLITVDLHENPPKKGKNKSKKLNFEKEKLKRKITHTTKWNNLNKESNNIFENLNIENIEELNENQRFFIQQIHRKIYSYKSQDIEKKLYDKEQFIDISGVIQLFKKSSLKCFYCLNDVQLFYEYVREPQQWTLERINNDFGHNYGNLEIACLSCNIKRRTMYHERFVFTKQLNIIKHIS
jgi:hypothetical protein